MNQCLTNFHIHEMNRCMFLMPGAATGIESRIVRKVKETIKYSKYIQVFKF